MEIVEPSRISKRTTMIVKAPVPKNAPAFFLAAFEEANKASRPVVIEFSAPWCTPCVRLKKETLAHPDVARLLEDVQLIDVDLDKYPELAKSYGVATIPDVFLIDPDGLIVDRLQAFEAPGPFLSRLKRLLGTKAETLHDLSEDGRELQKSFNRETGKVRLTLLVSPG